MALSWSPAVETSDAEERILSRCRKAKLFVFLRRHRHELFDEGFERELGVSDLALFDQGFHLGGWIESTRDEWHER